MSREVFLLVCATVGFVGLGVVTRLGFRRFEEDGDVTGCIVGSAAVVLFLVWGFFLKYAVMEFAKTLPSKVQPEVKVDGQ